ncbi:hypothetical protein BUALT_Bualt05G0171100 [Buddleja alternifolia]|uniref:Uncharacterized protein n=1 Tax=Buddleja alternifolia TaxID=168488 RepID=A0AAV6XRK8_9LAMI|nr:hypothetical protein BUALT_Bualt05G0171100 [Buddleja alternifolia]
MDEEEEQEIGPKSSDGRYVVMVDEEDNEKATGRRRQRQLLSELISQLESLEEDKINVAEESKQEEANPEEKPSSEIEASTSEVDKGNCSNEEIMKELKNVKRQNTITHCLVTAMIVLTLAWQLSEVSLILKIKDGLTNPFKSVGGILKGFLKKRTVINVQDAIKNASGMQNQVIEPPELKIPEFPNLELPGFDTSEDEE